MEKRMFAEKAPRVDTAKVYRALAMLALLPSCVLAGCAGEKGVDAGSSSSAPYGDSETATSQPRKIAIPRIRHKIKKTILREK